MSVTFTGTIAFQSWTSSFYPISTQIYTGGELWKRACKKILCFPVPLQNQVFCSNCFSVNWSRTLVSQDGFEEWEICKSICSCMSFGNNTLVSVEWHVWQRDFYKLPENALIWQPSWTLPALSFHAMALVREISHVFVKGGTGVWK